jgi:hypothetical protein
MGEMGVGHGFAVTGLRSLPAVRESEREREFIRNDTA